jgi:hypothetical protein
MRDELLEKTDTEQNDDEEDQIEHSPTHYQSEAKKIN